MMTSSPDDVGSVPEQEVVLYEDLEALTEPEPQLLYVKGGPSAWDGKAGRLLWREEGFVVLLIASSDDGGRSEFRVRFPEEMTTATVPKANA